MSLFSLEELVEWKWLRKRERESEEYER